MVEVWIIGTRMADAGGPAIDLARNVLAPEELRRAAGEPDPARSAAFTKARLALRLILSAYEPALAEGAPFRRGRHGKPVLDHGPHFSFSASPGAALVALSRDGPVGADIERLRDIPFAARALAGAPALAALGDERAPGDASARFLSAWTRFEATIKAEGRAMGPALDLLAPRLAAAPADALASHGQVGGDWLLTQVAAGHGFVAACAHRPGAALEVRHFDWKSVPGAA